MPHNIWTFYKSLNDLVLEGFTNVGDITDFVWAFAASTDFDSGEFGNSDQWDLSIQNDTEVILLDLVGN